MIVSPAAALGLFGRAGGLIAVGVALGFLVNVVHPRRVRFGGFTPPVACGAALSPIPSDGTPADVELLSPADVAGLCADPSALVADTRPAARFAEGHVVGAIHLPCTSSQGTASAALDLFATRKTIVVYGDTTDDALPVAREMRNRLGRPNVRVAVLDGGFPAWNHAGLACASGPCAACVIPAVSR